jgi:hypothetical protein
MRSFVVALALLACACGDVQKLTDAGGIDAYVPDTATPPTCGTGEMVCNGACENVMTSDVFCGNCTTQCTPTQGCLNGSCVDKASKCSSVRLWDPQAGDGVYYNPNTGVNMYCGFTDNQTIDDIMIWPYTNSPPSGYILMRATDFNDPVVRKAFIALYNAQGGIRSYSTWSSSNCCYSTVGGNDIYFGGQLFYPATGTMDACNIGSGYIGGSYYTFSRQGIEFFATLPDDFFAVRPPSEMATCMDGANPGFFMKRHFGVN